MSCKKTKIDGKKDKVIMMLRYSLKHFGSITKKETHVIQINMA